MGTDIKLIVEHKADGLWSIVNPPENWDSWGALEVNPDPSVSKYSREGWFSDRNYELFGWLAGVRGRQPMLGEELRGIPEDSPPATFKVLYGYDSLTHYTVGELVGGLDLVVVTHRGEVEEKVYREWKAGGEPFPSQWCGWSSVPVVKESAYLAGDRPRVSGPLAWAGFRIYCEWTLPGKVAFARFAKLLARLAQLDPDPNNVRVVVGFA